MKSHSSSRSRTTATSGFRTVLLSAFAFLALSALPLHGQDDRHAISKVPPVYPPIARQMRITGTVKVTATIDASGKVIKAESPSGNKILVLSAIDCVKLWKFSPGEGTVTVTVDISFEI